MTARRCVIAFAILWLAPAAARGAGEDRTLLTGNAHGVWLVRPSKGLDDFDVLVRPAGKKWEWVVREVPGVPAVAATSGSQLHVLLRKPLGHLVFSMGSKRHTPGLNPSPKDKHNRWPKGASPVAICASGPFGDSAAPTLVAVVPYRPSAQPATRKSPASRPATEPATKPAAKPDEKPATKPTRFQQYRGKSRNLAVFHTVNPQWQFLTQRENVHLPPEARVFVTVAREALYMLIAAPGGPNSLACWKKGAPWRPIALAGQAAAGEVVAMVTVQDRPVIVCASPAKTPDGADDDTRRQLHLAAYEGPEKGFRDQTLTRAGKAMTWTRDHLPLAAGMGEQCGLFWSDGEETKFAVSGLNGQAAAVYDVDAFARPPFDDDGAAVIQKFMWGLIAATFFCMFLLRPRTVGKPFVLPAQFRPGRLGRRLLAGLIDFVLFVVLATIVFNVTSGPMSYSQTQELLAAAANEHQIPVRLAYASIVAVAGFGIYGFFMERKYGATAGKLLMKLRVVGSEGAMPGTRGAALRNLTKIFEISWPLMLLVPMINRRRLRLGDLIAGTAVVEYDTSVPPPAPPPPPGGEDSTPPPRPPDEA